MAVIINEFEVFVEPPVEPAATEAAPAEAPPSPPLSPQDLRDVLNQQVERQIRLRAH